MSLRLPRAIGIALSLRERMAPLCERIEIAGSIRRARPVVNDLDLVVLAKDKLDFQARCASRWATVTSGPQNCIYQSTLSDDTPLQIDIFFAKPAFRDLLNAYPSNFGSLLLCRTGSKEHNIWLIEHAKRQGLKWNPYAGVFNGEGKLVASETEEEIFKALGLAFIPPDKRER